jgi:hypothetical protein
MSEDLEAHEYRRYMTERDEVEKLSRLLNELRTLFPDDKDRIDATRNTLIQECRS